MKRGGFALMAGLAVHDKAASDRAFLKLLPLIERGASDDRNFVKKAVNWALRNIGKRNLALNAAAIACAEKIRAAANKRAGGERGGDAGSAQRPLGGHRRAPRARFRQGADAPESEQGSGLISADDGSVIQNCHASK